MEGQKRFFPPLLVVLLNPGYEIRDPGATLFLHFTSQSVFCMFFMDDCCTRNFTEPGKGLHLNILTLSYSKNLRTIGAHKKCVPLFYKPFFHYPPTKTIPLPRPYAPGQTIILLSMS
jgi:hypothetical protein